MENSIKVTKALSESNRVKIIKLQGTMVGAKDLSISFLSGIEEVKYVIE